MATKSCLKMTEVSSASSSSSSSSSRGDKNVQFGRIHFREFPIIMGCNPSVGEGVPVTIGWTFFDEYDADIAAYERASNRSRSTAGGLCPRLDVTKRAKILLSQGYAMLEIVECTMEVLDAQQKRSDSIRNRKWDGLHNFLEVTKRRLKKTGTLGYGKSTSTLAAPAAPAAPSNSPRAPRMRTRRGSLVVASTNLPKDEAPRRRTSLDLGPLQPNADWALTA